MKKYNCVASKTLKWELTVEADNEDEAKFLIYNMDDEGQLQIEKADVGLVSVNYIREIENIDENKSVATIPNFDPNKQIALIWSTEDVLSVRPHLTEQQAMDVLEEVQRRHDATLGVTWDTLCYCADILYPES